MRRFLSKFLPAGGPAVALAVVAAAAILGVAVFTAGDSVHTANAPTLQVAQSGDSFQSLQSLPQPAGGEDPTSSFTGFLQAAFQLSVIAAGLLTVIVLVFAGFQYMMSDAFTSKQNAKQRIRNALIGLLIVLGSILLLDTINPNITGLGIFSSPQQDQNDTGFDGDRNSEDSPYCVHSEGRKNERLSYSNLLCRNTCRNEPDGDEVRIGTVTITCHVPPTAPNNEDISLEDFPINADAFNQDADLRQTAVDICENQRGGNFVIEGGQAECNVPYSWSGRIEIEHTDGTSVETVVSVERDSESACFDSQNGEELRDIARVHTNKQIAEVRVASENLNGCSPSQ